MPSNHTSRDRKNGQLFIYTSCLACGASFKQLSGRHLKEHGLDGKAYRVKYGIPRAQPLAAKETT